MTSEKGTFVIYLNFFLFLYMPNNAQIIIRFCSTYLLTYKKKYLKSQICVFDNKKYNIIIKIDESPYNIGRIGDLVYIWSN